MTDEPPQDDPRRATPPPPPPGPTPGGPPPGAPPPAGPPSPGQYGPPPGYGPPPATGPPPGYGAPRPYGPPSGYGTPPQGGYGQQPGYGPPPGYPPAPGYGTPPPSGAPSGYGAPGQPGDPRWAAPGSQYPSPGSGTDFTVVNPFDWCIMGAGVLAIIFSFFSYYTASARTVVFTITESFSAWHGFFGWFAAVVALLAAALLSVVVLGHVSVPFYRQATMVGFALATVSVLVALWVLPGNVPHGTGVSNGRGVGYWLSLIVIAIGLVLAFIRMRYNGAGRQHASRVGGNPGRGASYGSTPAAAGPPPSQPPTPPGGPPPAGPTSRPPGASPNPPPR
jgi:hypothetical protein